MNEQEFFQQGPDIRNTWENDPFLQSCLQRLLPPETFANISPGLAHLGERAAGEMLGYADDAQRNPPEHIPYDPWGKRIDDIRIADGWKQLHRVAAEEGVVATAYERKEGEHSRLHQFTRLYLYHPSSAICSCPLAMTDGAARVIELHGTESMRQRALRHLTSRDPETFWTSGQWMTERGGGSDVSRTATIARKSADGYRLHGAEWFTSATTSQMAFTLARIETDGEISPDLSLFYVELRDEQDQLQGIRINRLKDKLGTRALPTAELTLDGAAATLTGEPGRGVRTIATLLNITRLYNACSAASQMRRAVMLAADYAARREAFGKRLIDHPLHARTLSTLETETRGATLMVLHAAALLGRDEMNAATETERKLLRLLTPVTKLYTAKQCVAVCSEALESFGGAGYVEDTGLPVLLRDAQVLSIWEGTTNVLALDLLRAAGKDNSIPLWLDDVNTRLDALRSDELSDAVTLIRARIGAFKVTLKTPNPETEARRLAYAMARIHGAVLLAEQAAWESGQAETVTGARKALEDWLSREIVTA